MGHTPLKQVSQRDDIKVFAKLVGKAAWYVPYAALVGAVKAVRFGV